MQSVSGKLSSLSNFDEGASLGCGSVVKNPFANAGDSGSIPGQKDP